MKVPLHIVKLTKEMSDLETVLILGSHIENPCEIIVNGKRENIRYFYINEAKKILPTLINPYAKEYLESILSKYK
jgi:hypothetical protein